MRKAAVAKNARPDDLVQPGHIFPLQAVDGIILLDVSGSATDTDPDGLAEHLQRV